MLSLIKKYKLASFLTGLLLLLVLFPLILQIINHQKIAWGITIARQNVGGMNYQKAKEKIAPLINEQGKQPIELKYANKRWLLLPRELGVSFDINQTINDAYIVGRQKQENLLSRTIEQVESFFGHYHIDFAYQIDKQKIFDFIKNNLSEMEIPAKNATLIYDAAHNNFTFTPAQNGEVFDSYDLKNQIAKYIISQDRKPIEIKKITQIPALTQDKNDKAKAKSKKILSLAPFQLKYNNQVWPVDKDFLLDWLDFVPVFDQPDQTMATVISQSAVKDYLIELAPSINKEPINAQLTTQDGKVITSALSQNGAILKIEESAQKIAQEILQEKKEIELVIEETQPEITTQTIDTLGLTSLIGQGNSDFAGSPKNRSHNIGVGAAKFNGVLLEPGQEFSFNQYLGEIGPQQGYLPELVIKKNKTIPEYGGGLCQVSTTLFRAAINAGLKILERYPHAFPVKYYNPQGFDATIYPPHPDLRFINDTPAHMLIQSKIKDTKLTFEFYGTGDGREVKIIGPTILEANPDGSMKTVLYQEIWRDGTLERKDTFRSSYKSPALYPVERNPLE